MPVGLVLGGLHLMDKTSEQVREVIEQLKHLGVDKVAPCHCSGKKATKNMLKEYKDGFLNVKTGMTYSIRQPIQNT